jgi:hypothetical protein
MGRLAWQPISVDDRVYTPHRAIRPGHMIDHLAQLDAHLIDINSLPNEWHASAMTTPADLAPFRIEDLDEARSRLARLAQIWRVRLAAVPEGTLDSAEGDAYTPRETAFCVVGSAYYADAVGSIGQPTAHT